jgi:ubiquinone biosynthesis protein COQ9
MIQPPERSAARDAAILALLPLAGQEGWTIAALRRAAGPDADLLFPGGPADMVEAALDLADRRMVETADLEGKKLTGRVRALIAARLANAAPHRDAWRRAASLLAAPGHAALAATCTARTVDAIWYGAGDTSADFSWYTKRAILGAVHVATTLYWLRPDTSLDDALAFLDRRLAGVGRLNRFMARTPFKRA